MLGGHHWVGPFSQGGQFYPPNPPPSPPAPNTPCRFHVGNFPHLLSSYAFLMPPISDSLYKNNRAQTWQISLSTYFLFPENMSFCRLKTFRIELEKNKGQKAPGTPCRYPSHACPPSCLNDLFPPWSGASGNYPPASISIHAVAPICPPDCLTERWEQTNSLRPYMIFNCENSDILCGWVLVEWNSDTTFDLSSPRWWNSIWQPLAGLLVGPSSD